MENKITKSSAKDIFLHLLMLVALYAGIVSFIAVWFQYANFLFPDKLDYRGYSSYIYDTMRLAMSVLVVAFPIYLFVGWLLGREFKSDPEKREGRGRRWLLYFTMFASAMTIAIDLITLIYRFFAGDLATRFVLKIGVVMIVAAVVLWYFIWDLKSKATANKKPRIFAILAGVAILASIIYGFSIMGTPSHQRSIRMDEKRIENLQNIQSAISNYWVVKKLLPENLAVLEGDLYGVMPKDPETGANYTYKILTKTNFEICANFKTASDENQISLMYYNLSGDWSHGIGTKCFPRNAEQLSGGSKVVPMQ